MRFTLRPDLAEAPDPGLTAGRADPLIPIRGPNLNH
jgi:hypothetical protein